MNRNYSKAFIQAGEGKHESPTPHRRPTPSQLGSYALSPTRTNKLPTADGAGGSRTVVSSASAPALKVQLPGSGQTPPRASRSRASALHAAAGVDSHVASNQPAASSVSLAAAYLGSHPGPSFGSNMAGPEGHSRLNTPVLSASHGPAHAVVTPNKLNKATRDSDREATSGSASPSSSPQRRRSSNALQAGWEALTSQFQGAQGTMNRPEQQEQKKRNKEEEEEESQIGKDTQTMALCCCCC